MLIKEQANEDVDKAIRGRVFLVQEGDHKAL